MNTDAKIALSAYYKGKGFNNADIAGMLRVDLSSVSRYLKQAEENGWLRQKLEITLPQELDRFVQSMVRLPDLEEAIHGILAMRDVRRRREGVVVVRHLDGLKSHSPKPNRHPMPVDDYAATVMYAEGARLLLDLLSQHDRGAPIVLGVTWGRSTGGVVAALGEMSLPDLPNLTVVALQGGVGRTSIPLNDGSEYYPDVLAERLSQMFRSRRAPVRISLPPFIGAEVAEQVGEVGLKSIWKFIENDASFKEAALLHQQLDVALVGVGGLEDSAWAVTSGYLPTSDSAQRLTRDGAVGDIVCRFFRERMEAPIEGWEVRSRNAEAIRKTNLRAIGISLAHLRSRVAAGARVIAVAGGQSGAKAAAVRAALMCGFASDLVTDEPTALKIVKDYKPE